MADIIVDTYKLYQYAQRLSDINARISNLDKRLDSLYTKVGLTELFDLIRADALTGYSWRLARCRDYLRQTAWDFEETEKRLGKLEPSDFNSPLGVIWLDMLNQRVDYWPDSIINIIRGGISPGAIGFGAAQSALSLITDEGWEQFWNGGINITDEQSAYVISDEDGNNYIKILNKKYTVTAEPEYGVYKDEDGIAKIKQKEKKKDSWQTNPDKEWYDKNGTIIEGKVGDKKEYSVIDVRSGGESEYAAGHIEGKLLTAEAHREVSAGLYVYVKNEDGTVSKILSPGVSAEIGTSVAVAQVHGEGRFGLGEDNNMLGVYGNVDGELLAAELEGKFALNSNEIYAGGSMEANLAKISGTGGVSVLGTDLGVSGSLKLGIGAHGEIGFTDGKLKVDIGAAIGVGFDLGFEVDVSGTVDAVCDFAGNAWEDTKEFVSDAGDFVADTWNNATDAVSEAWDNTKDFASDVWNFIF